LKKTKIEIKSTDASYLMDELEVTHKLFERTDESSLTRLLKEFLSDEISHGVETSERMLKTGSMLYGYGKLEKNIWKNTLSLKKPTISADHIFILTNKSRDELVDTMQTERTVFKVAMVVCGMIGAGIGVAVLYKLYKKRQEQIRKAKLDDERKSIREERLRVERERGDHPAANNNSDTACVLCLQNPREIILLDCGHICLCFDCLERLGNTSCPICRQNYTHYARCYMP
jgi:E3 ubiquitin-protein ligase MUL1